MKKGQIAEGNVTTVEFPNKGIRADGAAAGRAVRHGDRRMDGAVYGGAGPSGAGDAVYHLGAFSGGGLHSGDVGAGTAAELSVDGEGAAGVPE